MSLRNASTKNTYQKAYYEKNKDYFREYARARRKRTKSENRQYNLKKLYGLTLEEYNEMSDNQGGRCAVCGDIAKLAVDHNHETGSVRGLLCTNCNLALGHFKDNIEVMSAAINYLSKFNA